MTAEDELISEKLIDAIRAFPVQKKIRHCDSVFAVSPFDLYAVCPGCQSEIKVRSFSESAELEDVFDAFFEWMVHPRAKESFRKRQKELIEDID